MKTYFWETNWFTYTHSDLHEWINALKGGDNFVLADSLTELSMTFSSGLVTVNPGRAVIDGKPYLLDAQTTIAIPAISSGKKRKDFVVLRADYTARTVRLAIKTGTEGAVYTAPSLSTVSGSVYEVVLYSYQLDGNLSPVTVVDARPFFRHANAEIKPRIFDFDSFIPGSLDLTKFAADFKFSTNMLADGAIDASKIANGAVGTDQITSKSIESIKIANGGITNSSFAASAITTEKIADGAISESLIPAGSLPITKILSGQISNSKFQDGSINEDRFSVSITIPVGGIIMWYGTLANLPAGWAVVSELNGRFPVGAGNSYAVGATGGAFSTTITHNHVSSLSTSVGHYHSTGSMAVVADEADWNLHTHTATINRGTWGASSNNILVFPDSGGALRYNTTTVGIYYGDLNNWGYHLHGLTGVVGSAADTGHTHTLTIDNDVKTITTTPNYMALYYIKRTA